MNKENFDLISYCLLMLMLLVIAFFLGDIRDELRVVSAPLPSFEGEKQEMVVSDE